MLDNVVINTELIRLGKDKEDFKENAEEPDKLDYTHSPQMFRHTIMLLRVPCSQDYHQDVGDRWSHSWCV